MSNKINNKILVTRKKLYRDIQEYTNLKKKNKEDYLESSDTYPCTWFINNGYYKLKSFFSPEFFNSKVQLLKEIILISKLSSYKTYNIKNLSNFKINTLYISWCTSNDFKNNGDYKDKYIPNPSKKNSHWFLLNIGNFIQTKNKNKNYTKFQKKKKQKYDIFFLIKSFFKILIKKNFNLFKLKSLLSVDTVFAYMINDEILKLLVKKKIKKVILTYEAQPFQKLLIDQIRKLNKNIKIISYLTAVQPFPIHLFDGKNIPDKNFSVSKAQIYQLTNIFDWNKKKINLIKSHRFNKNSNLYKNNILLPYIIVNENKMFKNIINLFEKNPNNFFNKPKIIPHPIGIQGKKYKIFVTKLQKAIEEFDYIFEKKIIKKNCLTVGSSSVVFDALEHGLKVYHIVNEPVLEGLDSFFWPTVEINSFNDNVLIYSTKYKKKLVNY